MGVEKSTSLPTRDAAIEEAAKVAFETMKERFARPDMAEAVQGAILALIGICETCSGRGVYNSYDYKGRAYEFECFKCDGTGKSSTPTSGEASAPPPLSEGWTPTAANINALPDPLRRYIHDLETRCDPTGDVQTIHSQREQINGLLKRVRELSTPAESVAGAREEVTEEVQYALEGMKRLSPKHQAALEQAGYSKNAFIEFYGKILAALEASPVKELEAALEIAAHRFRTYETLHRNKGTSEGYEKAASNGDMARLCEAALNQYRGGKA